jgi:small subunit ribosomal protein S16
MAIKIRLARGGAKHSPFYNIVVADTRYPRDGKFLEKLGFYNPKVHKEKETDQNKRVHLNGERVKYWISVGAQVSDTMARLLTNNGLEEASKFIKPIVKGEFYGVSRKERNKILAERADAAKKAAAARKKAKEEAAKAASEAA